MSIRVTTWVWDSAPDDVTSTELLILLAIADHASDDGTNAWPSLATLARKARTSHQQAKRSVRRLTERGLIIREVNHGGDKRVPEGQRPNLYTVVLQPSLSMDQSEAGGSSMTPVTDDPRSSMTPEGGHTEPPRGVTDDPQTVLEPSSTTSSLRSVPDEVEKSTKRKRKTAVALPEGWVPDAAGERLALELGFTAEEARFELEQFVDYWRGVDGRKADWAATWRTWLRSEVKRGRPRKASPEQAPATTARCKHCGDALKPYRGGWSSRNGACCQTADRRDQPHEVAA